MADSSSDPLSSLPAFEPLSEAQTRRSLFPLVVGQFFAFALFGISALQFYYCYRLLRQSTVRETFNAITLGIFFVLDVTDQVLKGEFFWKQLEGSVTKGLVAAFYPTPSIIFPVAAVGGAFIPLATHVFYIRRIYRISQQWKYRIYVWAVLALCLGGSLMAAGFGVYSGYKGKLPPYRYSEIIHIPIPWLAGDAFVDCVLSLILVIYLRSQKSDFKATNDLLFKWIALSLESGLLPAATAITDLVVALVYPLDSYHFAIFYVLSKIYINSVLVLFHITLQNKIRSQSGTTYGSTGKSGSRLGSNGGVMVHSEIETAHEFASSGRQVVNISTIPTYRTKDGMDDLSAFEKTAGFQTTYQ